MHENRQFPARWTVDTMTNLFDDTAAAKGDSASLTAKIAAMDAEIAGKISSIPIASEDAVGAVKIGSGIHLEEDGTISVTGGGGGGGGTTDYRDLDYKPQINSVTLTGDKSSSDLGLQSAITSSAKLSADVVDDTSTTNKFVSSSDKSTWSGKQDAIADLTAIRSGANAGATAVQTIKINGTVQAKTSGVVNLPAYPTTLPASNTVSTYSETGTAPVNGRAVKAALETLYVSPVGGTGKYISAISETNGVISASESQIDSVPTENSTNPITSGVVYDDRTALAELIDSGAKNLLKISGTSQTISGITFTVNSDGSISASGTATSDAVFNMTTNLNLQPGSYVFSPGFPNGSSGTTFFCDIFNSGYSNRSVAYQERSIPDTTKIIRFIVVNGYTANNITFFPMVCTAANHKISAAFVPYRPSYQELCDRIAALEEGGTS